MSDEFESVAERSCFTWLIDTQTVEVFESRRLPASFGVDLVRASCFVAQ